MCYYLSDLRRDDNFLHTMTEEIAKEITVEKKRYMQEDALTQLTVEINY